MRTVLALFALLGAISPAGADPSIAALLKAEGVADAYCRGSTDPDPLKREGECSRRDRLYGRLTQAGWCYGKVGQVGGDMRWHPCGPGSVRADDLGGSAAARASPRR